MQNPQPAVCSRLVHSDDAFWCTGADLETCLLRLVRINEPRQQAYSKAMAARNPMFGLGQHSSLARTGSAI